MPAKVLRFASPVHAARPYGRRRRPPRSVPLISSRRLEAAPCVTAARRRPWHSGTLEAFLPDFSDFSVKRNHLRMVVNKAGEELQINQLSDGEKRQDFSHRGADEKSLLDEALRRGRESVAGRSGVMVAEKSIAGIVWLRGVRVFLSKRAAFWRLRPRLFENAASRGFAFMCQVN